MSPRWIRPFVLAIVVAAAVAAAGPRSVVSFRDLDCGPGRVAQPAGIMGGVYTCEPARQVPEGAIHWPQVAPAERRVALYLANLRVRVFDYDSVHGPEVWLAWNVPAPE